jgi:hypothetical protein
MSGAEGDVAPALSVLSIHDHDVPPPPPPPTPSTSEVPTPEAGPSPKEADGPEGDTAVETEAPEEQRPGLIGSVVGRATRVGSRVVNAAGGVVGVLSDAVTTRVSSGTTVVCPLEVRVLSLPADVVRWKWRRT